MLLYDRPVAECRGALPIIFVPVLYFQSIAAAVILSRDISQKSNTYLVKKEAEEWLLRLNSITLLS